MTYSCISLDSAITRFVHCAASRGFTAIEREFTTSTDPDYDEELTVGISD